MTTQEILQTIEEELTLVRPAITVYESENDFLIEAEMPGVAKGKIEVTLEDEHLIFSGSREWNAPEKSQVLHQETFPVKYYRDLTLGKDVQRDGVQASYENGILRVQLQKAETAKPKQIKVEVK